MHHTPAAGDGRLAWVSMGPGGIGGKVEHPVSEIGESSSLSLFFLCLSKKGIPFTTDTFYRMNYLKFISSTFPISIMQLTPPKETEFEVFEASEETRQKAHSMGKPSLRLFGQHPGAEKTCVSSRWF